MRWGLLPEILRLGTLREIWCSAASLELRSWTNTTGLRWQPFLVFGEHMVEHWAAVLRCVEERGFLCSPVWVFSSMAGAAEMGDTTGLRWQPFLVFGEHMVEHWAAVLRCVEERGFLCSPVWVFSSMAGAAEMGNTTGLRWQPFLVFGEHKVEHWAAVLRCVEERGFLLIALSCAWKSIGMAAAIFCYYLLFIFTRLLQFLLFLLFLLFSLFLLFFLFLTIMTI